MSQLIDQEPTRPFSSSTDPSIFPPPLEELLRRYDVIFNSILGAYNVEVLFESKCKNKCMISLCIGRLVIFK